MNGSRLFRETKMNRRKIQAQVSITELIYNGCFAAANFLSVFLESLFVQKTSSHSSMYRYHHRDPSWCVLWLWSQFFYIFLDARMRCCFRVDRWSRICIAAAPFCRYSCGVLFETIWIDSDLFFEVVSLFLLFGQHLAFFWICRLADEWIFVVIWQCSFSASC